MILGPPRRSVLHCDRLHTLSLLLANHTATNVSGDGLIRAKRAHGPAAATGERARALGQKEANDKAAEAVKKAAKLTEELAVAKAQLQKERKRRVTEGQEEVSISKPRKPSTSARKKAVSTVN